MFLSSWIRDADRSFLLKWGGSARPNTSHLNSAAKRVIYYPCCASCSPRALFIERLCNFHLAEIPFLNISKRTITETLQKQYRKVFMQTCVCIALRRSQFGFANICQEEIMLFVTPARCRCNRNKHTRIGLKGTFLMNKSVLHLLTHFCMVFVLSHYAMVCNQCTYMNGHLKCQVKEIFSIPIN